MKKLFLTSSFYQSADKLAELVPNPKGMKAVFVSTARDPYPTAPWADADWQKLLDLGFNAEMYDIKGKNEAQIYNDLKDKDVIFVCGGNTFYLLYHAQQSGFDKAAVRLVNEGKVYIGSSAGSSITGPSIELTKTLDKLEAAPNLKSFDGLKLVDFIPLSHTNSEKYGERNRKIIEEYKGDLKLVPITDSQAIVVTDSGYKVI